MTSGPDMMVVGSINIDGQSYSVLVRQLDTRGGASQHADDCHPWNRIVNSGETIASTSYTRRAGGKGANTAVAIAKAGGNVAFFGTIGTDGNFLCETLRTVGVDISNLSTSPTLPTGRALIQLSTSTKDNSIILFPGANYASESFSPPRFPTLPKLLLLQNEIPLSRTKEAALWAASNGIDVLWNPSPLPSQEELKEAFDEGGWASTSLSWLIMNRGEMNETISLLEGGPTGGDGSNLLDRMRGRVETAGRMVRMKGIVMTLGSDGSDCLLVESGRRIGVAAGKVGEDGVKDTTGAGDCFTGYLASRLAILSGEEKVSTEEVTKALELASQASAMCVEKEGAMESFPSIEEVMRIMQCA